MCALRALRVHVRCGCMSRACACIDPPAADRGPQPRAAPAQSNQLPGRMWPCRVRVHVWFIVWRSRDVCEQINDHSHLCGMCVDRVAIFEHAQRRRYVNTHHHIEIQTLHTRLRPCHRNSHVPPSTLDPDPEADSEQIAPQCTTRVHVRFHVSRPRSLTFHIWLSHSLSALLSDVATGRESELHAHARPSSYSVSVTLLTQQFAAFASLHSKHQRHTRRGRHERHLGKCEHTMPPRH
jgi:hypothetical protein